MLAAHWREAGTDRATIPLSINWKLYRQREAAGEFKCMSARIEGDLVGYNAFFVLHHLHYSTSLHALNDVLYVDPQRRGYPGIRLILEAEKALQALGVKRVLYHSKLHVRLGGGTKDGVVDSLDALNDLLDIEAPAGFEVSEEMMVKVGAGDVTLGDVLTALGYPAIETVHSKVL